MTSLAVLALGAASPYVLRPNPTDFYGAPLAFLQGAQSSP